ncbi:hypothetical protein [Mycobacterium sp. DBP42]|uniref:hypothetical protein n=1 Tax=Mycobacteriaceae TaxID=1762 RepID=UPI00110D18C5|nr:hypothetical protein [Mycobacterium sp. DBP42]TMS46975.1 hypothetical protein E0T84_29380 [Mycobacterium sp. DBP42]
MTDAILTVGDVDVVMTHTFQTVIVCSVLVAVFILRQRIWRAAQEGRWWPAVVAGLGLYLASDHALDGLYQPGARWYDQPVTSGWQVAVLALNYIGGGLAVAAWVTIAVMAWVAVRGVRVWLNMPLADPWSSITHADQLRRDWRLRRYEDQLTKSIATHVIEATPDHCATITRQRVCDPDRIITWFMVGPPYNDVEGLRRVVVDTPMVHHADPITGSDHITRIRVTWDRKELIRPSCGHRVVPRFGVATKEFRARHRFGRMRPVVVANTPVLGSVCEEVS